MRPDPDRRTLIARCVDQGLCTPQECDAQLCWRDSTREELPGYAWPVRLSRWSDMEIAHRTPEPLEAKAYLGFMIHFSLI